MGAMVALRSAGENPLPSSSVYIADSMGELGLFYRLCPISFVGGSLIPHGGHNPIEPAQLDSAIVHGPYMQNFRDIAAELSRSNAAVKVMDEAELGQAIGRLLSDDLEAGRLAHAARRVAEAKSAVMDQVLSELAPFLLALAGPRHAGA